MNVLHRTQNVLKNVEEIMFVLLSAPMHTPDAWKIVLNNFQHLQDFAANKSINNLKMRKYICT